jgi:uncharacterized membrane protein YraQ (UPF0718 family)
MTVIAKVSETETKTQISAAEATEEASEEFETALKNTLKSVQEAVSLILFDCLLACLLAFHWTRRKQLLLSISGLSRVEDKLLSLLLSQKEFQSTTCCRSQSSERENLDGFQRLPLVLRGNY